MDISLFTNNKDSYIEDDSWISSISNEWVYSPDKYYFNDVLVPTRLVIYEGGVKVDYPLWSVDVAAQLAKSDYFDTGYKVYCTPDFGPLLKVT